MPLPVAFFTVDCLPRVAQVEGRLPVDKRVRFGMLFHVLLGMAVAGCSPRMGPTVPVGVSREAFARAYLPTGSLPECGPIAIKTMADASPPPRPEDVVCSVMFRDTSYVVMVLGREGQPFVGRSWLVPVSLVDTKERELIDQMTARFGSGEPCRSLLAARRWNLGDSASISLQVVRLEPGSGSASFRLNSFPPGEKC